MKILAADPALSTSGFALVEFDEENKKLSLKEIGLIKTTPKVSLPERLKKIYDEFEKIIKKYKPQILLLEKFYTHLRHPYTIAVLSEVKGVLILLASQNHMEVLELPSTYVKKALTGKGNVKKYQIKKMIEFFVKEKIYSQHISDALALTFAYLNIKRCFVE